MKKTARAPMDIKKLFDEGEALIRKGMTEEAIELYSNIAAHAGQKDHVLWAKKHVADLEGYCGRRNFRKAIQLYRDILGDGTKDSELIRWCNIDIDRSEAELSKGDQQEATS